MINSAVPGWVNSPGVVPVHGDFNSDGRTDIALINPGGGWNTAPVLFANGNGTWSVTNSAVPGWVNSPGVVPVPGDFNSDGRTDIALINPGGGWNTAPVLFANGNGTWSVTNSAVPGWVNSPGVVPVPGDFNSDGRTDIALINPGGGWNTAPVLFANGNGTWSVTNSAVPGWVNSPGVVPVPGDFNSDGRTDIALINPGGGWNTAPVLFANGNGTWSVTNSAVPGWVNSPGVVPVPGDFNSDGRTDIALINPGGGWNTAPVLFANGNGTWSVTNSAVPGWVNSPGVVPVPGDFNSDGRTDIALINPGGGWNTAPVLFANGNGTWSVTNSAVPGWVNSPGVVPVPGDFNSDGRTDIALINPGGGWNTAPVLFANGNGIASAPDLGGCLMTVAPGSKSTFWGSTIARPGAGPEPGVRRVRWLQPAILPLPRHDLLPGRCAAEPG